MATEASNGGTSCDKSCDHPKSDNGSYSELVKWIRASPDGFVHESLELKGQGSSRGIFASKPISCGEILVSLPASHAVSGSHLPASYSKERGVSDWLRSIAAYFEARRKDGHFRPYLESLSPRYESLLDWSDQEIESYLAGTALGSLVLKDRREKILETRYRERVRPYLDHLGLLAEGDDELLNFRTACMCISTRGFHLEDAGAGSYSGPLLLPWIDLLNHDPIRKCTTLKWDKTKNCFSMKAERVIDAGEEVYHAYASSLSSVEVLKTFGFVPDQAIKAAMDDAETDEEHITPGVLSICEVVTSCRAVAESSFPLRVRSYMSTMADEEEERWELKHDMSTRDLSSLPGELLVSTKDPLSDELVTAFSILLLPDDVYSALIEEEITRLDSSMLDDFYLGKLVCQSIAWAVTEKLATYTPIYIDGQAVENLEDASLLRNLLCSQPELPRAVYGLVIRIKEKKCLKSLLSTVQSISNSLGGTSIDCGERAQKKVKL